MKILMPDDGLGGLDAGDVFALRLRDETLVLYRVVSKSGNDYMTECLGFSSEIPEIAAAISAYEVRSQLRQALRLYVNKNGAPSRVSLKDLVAHGGPDPALTKIGPVAQRAVYRVYYAVPSHNCSYSTAIDGFEVWPHAK